jgi:hypothetical protein
MVNGKLAWVKAGWRGHLAFDSENHTVFQGSTQQAGPQDDSG